MKSNKVPLVALLLPLCTAIFITGIALAPEVLIFFRDRSEHQILAASGLATALCLAAALALLLRKKALFALTLLGLASLFCGVFHAALALQRPSSAEHIYQRISASKEMVIIGDLCSSSGAADFSSLLVQSRFLSDKGRLIPVRGRVLLRLKGRLLKEYLPGERLAIRCRLKRPQSYLTPGVFDYARHLALKDIWVTGFISSELLIKKVLHKPSLLQRLARSPAQWRARAALFIEENGKSQQGMLKALLLGDRSAVRAEDLEAFANSGVLHILAISGLHLTVVGAGLYLLLYAALSRISYLLLFYSVKKIALFLSLIPLLAYTLLAGGNTPVTRAFTMVCIGFLALSADRKYSAPAIISTTLLILLLIKPLQLFTASFQLSFVAVSGILIIFPRLEAILLGARKDQNKESMPSALWKKGLAWLAAALLISFTATLVTAPIAMLYFNRIAPVGILANIVIEPLLCLWSLPTGLFALILCFFSPDLARPFLAASEAGICLSLQLVEHFAAIPYGFFRPADPRPWQIISYFALLFYAASLRDKEPKKTLVFWSCILPLLSLILLPSFANAPVTRAGVAILDVGQGAATLLETSGGQRILVDCGATTMSKRSIGERVIAPYLWSRGITRLDAIVISHPDADHYNGLSFILKNFSPISLWLRAMESPSTSYAEKIARAKELGVEIRTGQTGQSLDSSLKIIHNFKAEGEQPAGSGREMANRGLVLQFCCGGFCLLLPGDIDARAERFLIKQGASLKSEILVAAHHGSKTSNSGPFLQAVRPLLIVASAGKSKKGLFPHPDLVERASKMGLGMISTASHGTISLTTDQAGGLEAFYYLRPRDNPLLPLRKQKLDGLTANPSLPPVAGATILR